MNELLSKYLQNSKNKELIKRGLYETKYYDNKDVTKEMKKTLTYSHIGEKWYELIPIEVTDKEFENLLKIPHLHEQEKHTSVVTWLYGLGILIIIGGLIGGFSFGQASTGWGITLSIWVCSIISGMTFIGFGKIIEILEQIRNK